MRLGPKEKQIIRALTPGEWTPPSVYMAAVGGFRSCPSGYTLNRVVAKGLAEFRYMTWSAADRRREAVVGRQPGRETAEHNAALRLTEEGIAAFWKIDRDISTAIIRDLTSDLPF